MLSHAGKPGSTGELLAAYYKACYYRTMALADASKTQYDAHVRYFTTWCVYMGVSAHEPSEALVCAYVATLAETVKASTVVQYLKGLKNHYRNVGYTVFADPTAWRELYQVLKGIKRARQDVADKKRPITPGMLLAFKESLDMKNPLHVATFAACLVAFFGFFRKSNIAVQSTSAFSDGKCLRCCDIRVDAKEHALIVTPPGSKTRQFGAAPSITIAGEKWHPLDPVAAWCNHMALSGVPSDSQVTAFSYVASGKRTSLTHDVIVQAAKTMARLTGLDPAEVAGHSFRRGGATWAFQCGASEILVQRQGDWLSACYKEYIELSKGQLLACTKIMFANLPAALASKWQHERMQASATPAGHLPGGQKQYASALV